MWNSELSELILLAWQACGLCVPVHLCRLSYEGCRGALLSWLGCGPCSDSCTARPLLRCSHLSHLGKLSLLHTPTSRVGLLVGNGVAGTALIGSLARVSPCSVQPVLWGLVQWDSFLFTFILPLAPFNFPVTQDHSPSNPASHLYSDLSPGNIIAFKPSTSLTR